ncbi:MAG: hypothetical protein J6A56_02090 [Clostridia bacterium]|nr:hypothetical protein [Clostridia bacterium]
MRKTFLCFGVFLLISSLLTGTVGFANEIETFSVEDTYLCPIGGVYRPEPSLSPVADSPLPFRLSAGEETTQEGTVYDALLKGCEAHAELIDIAAYHISLDEIENVCYNFTMLYPEALIVGCIPYEYYTDTSMVINVIPVYLFANTDEDNAARELMVAKIAEYCDSVKNTADPLEQLLFVHDKIAHENAYDTDAAEVGLNAETFPSFHAYGLLADKTAVCQGYAQVFYIVAKELGFEVSYCYNNEHIWNYIKLDGEWYHLDVTHDDPLDKNGQDVPNTTSHAYFLRSDASIFGENHPKPWFSPLGTMPDCKSTKYQTGHLFNFPGRKTIEKTENGYYRFNYVFKNDQDEVVLSTNFYTQKLKTDIISSQPQDGLVYYSYLREPTAPVTILTQYKDTNGISIKVGVGVSKPWVIIESGGQHYPLYTYTPPRMPPGTTSGKLFFWNIPTLAPCGLPLEF